MNTRQCRVSCGLEASAAHLRSACLSRSSGGNLTLHLQEAHHAGCSARATVRSSFLASGFRFPIQTQGVGIRQPVDGLTQGQLLPQPLPSYL